MPEPSSLPARRTTWTLSLVTLALLAAPLPAGAAGESPGTTAAPRTSTASSTTVRSVHRVTLLTGDTLTVTQLADGRTTVAADPDERATRGGLRTVSVDDDLYVFPASAMPFVASGAFDRQLFNVTGLIEQGLADDQRRTLPVIVQYASNAAARSDTSPPGAVRTRSLSSIDAVAVNAKKQSTEHFWHDLTGKPADAVVRRPDPQLQDGVEKVWLDGRVEASLADSVAQIGAPTVWDAGYDGTGVTVAVLDSGIDADHPDLAGQVDGSQSFVPGETVKDVLGHGTHVASTIVGTGAASGGVERGVAPGAHLMVGKVLGDDGFGQDSWIIDGMEWAAAHADIVSMSLGTPEPSDGTDPMSQALDTLSEETGALFVVAAGNSYAEQTIGAPGAADDALTVGAVDGSDALAWFSSQGPRLGDMALKPDLVAPGVDILAARSQYSPDGSGYYLTMSGTSMATPHVAGAAALLAERHPAWSGARLKDALMSTSARLDGTTPFQVGTGRVDVPAAVLGDVSATGSVFFGFDRWPHAGETPVTRDVTYRNDSDAAVTLDLELDVHDSSGATPPSGLFSLSATSLTVPAHAADSVQVTVDPTLGGDGQRYLGQLLARSAGTVVAHSSVGFVKEDERYDLTIRLVDRNGSPVSGYVDLIGAPVGYTTVPVDGTTTLRLPPATYAMSTWLDVDADTDHAGVALVSRPDVQLSSNRTVVLDARAARPVTAHVPRPRAEASSTQMTWYRDLDGVQVQSGYMAQVWVDHFYATPTSPVRTGAFDFSTRWRLRQPLLSIAAFGQPLDVIAQAGSPLFHGHARLRAVVAGDGAPSDYAGLDATGKVAIVTRSDAVSPYDRALAAHDAGASLLLVVNDRPTELSEWVGGPLGERAPIPVATVSGTEGARLVGGGNPPRSLALVGHPQTAWVYDLQHADDGAIPTSLAFAPAPEQLALVRGEYASDRPAAAGEFRYDFRPYMSYSTGFMESLTLPQVRREWVSTEAGTTWYQEAMQLDPAWDQRGVREALRPGQRVTSRWFSPVVRPRLGEGYWRPTRSGSFVAINLPAWADSGSGHTGDMYFSPGVVQRIWLYDDKGGLIKKADDQATWVDLSSPRQKRYRLTTVATRDPDRWSTSTRTRTTWRFWSRAPRDGVADLPLLSLDYRVATDLAGRVGPGATPIRLSAVPVDGADLGGTVTGARLAASFDGGRTWRRVPLTAAGDAAWQATVPRLRSSDGAVALRAAAWDSRGNRVTQVVIRAYRLR